MTARQGDRIAYLVNQYPKVSHTFIRREILALERRGLTVSRFSIRGWDAPLADPVDEEERSKTRYILRAGALPLLRATLSTLLTRPRAALTALKTALSMSRRSLRPWPYHLIWFAEACLLREWLASDRIDHLHAHFGTNSADVALLQHLLGGPTYSFTIHGPDEFDQAPMLNLPRKVEGARFVAVISAFTRSQLMRAIPAQLWPKLQVVHCGLDEAFFAAEPAPLPDSPTLLCIGRLNAQKGHVTLLEGFAAMNRPDARLILAGDGELRDLVEERIRTLGLTGRVQITGWISSDEVMRLITQSRVIVQPSFMEGLPVVLMEALAQGRPVISTFVAGIPELVQDGINGWLVPAGDSDRLAQAMAAALDTAPPDLSRMGRDGMARVRTRHHIDTEAAKLAALFART
jgi:glycosyltransferase involved in cell wall biosynthesis